MAKQTVSIFKYVKHKLKKRKHAKAETKFRQPNERLKSASTKTIKVQNHGHTTFIYNGKKIDPSMPEYAEAKKEFDRGMQELHTSMSELGKSTKEILSSINDIGWPK